MGRGTGNINAEPLLTPDGHLTAGSPCRDAGDPDDIYANLLDRDREPRLTGAAVDMGADEFVDTDADELPDAWELIYFDDPILAEPDGDADSDGADNHTEYEQGTHPLHPPRAFFVSPHGDNRWDGLTPTWNGTSGPKAAVQAAIDAAHMLGPDEVVLADGTYTGYGNRDIDLEGKAITVRSAAGDPGRCIIDCEGGRDEPHRGFRFSSGEGADSRLQGLTIVGGDVRELSGGCEGGGGVQTLYSSPRLENCIISGNTASYGGGAEFHHGAPMLTNCRISDNLAHCPTWGSGNGGGLYARYGNLALESCLFSGNEAIGSYAAIRTADCDLTLANCTITGNRAREECGRRVQRGRHRCDPQQHHLGEHRPGPGNGRLQHSGHIQWR